MSNTNADIFEIPTNKQPKRSTSNLFTNSGEEVSPASSPSNLQAEQNTLSNVNGLQRAISSSSSTSSDDVQSVPDPYTGASQLGSRHSQAQSQQTRLRSNSIRSFLSQELSDSDSEAENRVLKGYHGDDMLGTINLTNSLRAALQKDEEKQVQDLGSSSDISETESKRQAVDEMPPIKRRRSTIVAAVKDKFNFWDEDFRKERGKQFGRLAILMFGLMTLFMAVISVYTGTYYHRDHRFKNLKFYVMNGEQETDGIPPLFGQTVAALAQNAQLKQYGDWQVYDMSRLALESAKHHHTWEQEVRRKVLHNECWGAIWVKPFTTADLVNAIVNNQTDSYNTSTPTVLIYYATGRDLIAESNYIASLVAAFQQGYWKAVPQLVYEPLFQNVFNSFQVLEILNNPNLLLTLTTKGAHVELEDINPVQSQMIIPALQLGMVYILLFSFFGFVSSLKIHVYVSKRVHGRKFLVYRFLASQSIYFILALAYCSLNAMFKVPYNNTFGNSGFLVLWSVTFIGINAVGSINECVALYCFYWFPPSVGPWILMAVVFNIAPTFSAIALCPPFYRYGYAMPIHNLFELLKVVFCNSYKGHMGRNLGVLIAWAVVGNTILPLVQTHVGKLMRQKAQDAENAKVENAKDKTTESEKKEGLVRDADKPSEDLMDKNSATSDEKQGYMEHANKAEKSSDNNKFEDFGDLDDKKNGYEAGKTGDLENQYENQEEVFDSHGKGPMGATLDAVKAADE